MVSFVIFILLLFFFKYFGKNDINQVNNLNVKRDKIATNEMSNFIKDINYTSIDEKGNEYLITAATSEIDIRDSDVMFLDDVIAYIYLKDADTIKITSDFGKYNSKNSDTIFSKNVIVTYPSHKITGDYLDFSLINDLGTMSTNVFYSGEKNNFFSDMLEMKISTKDAKIFMYDDKEKVLIEGKK